MGVFEGSAIDRIMSETLRNEVDGATWILWELRHKKVSWRAWFSGVTCKPEVQEVKRGSSEVSGTFMSGMHLSLDGINWESKGPSVAVLYRKGYPLKRPSAEYVASGGNEGDPPEGCAWSMGSAKPVRYDGWVV